MSRIPRGAWLFAGVWLVGFLLFYSANHTFGHYAGPVSRTLPLAYGLPRITLELLVLYAIVRPPSFRRSWGRPLAGLVIFVPWLWYSASDVLSRMHGPQWEATHIAWLILIAMALLLVTIVNLTSALAETWRDRRFITILNR